jgi:hypothetical protein
MENTRPTTPLEKEALEYLNELRISGITNMLGAAPFVEAELKVDRKESIRLLTLWMENFNEEGDYENVLNS